MFYANESFSLYIDGYSTFNAAKSLNMMVDFKKLRAEFLRRGKMKSVRYYTLLDERDDTNPIRPMIDWLSYNGFHIIKKQPFVSEEEDGYKRLKGSIDVEIAVDMLMEAPRLDHLVLFSGNKDLAYAVDAVKRLGCRVSVVSSTKSASHLCSDELRRQADEFIELDSLRELICKG